MWEPIIWRNMSKHSSTVNKYALSRRRLSVDIPEDLYQRLSRLVPHGLRVVIFEILINDLCDSIETNGNTIFGAVCAKKIGLSDISDTLKGKKDA